MLHLVRQYYCSFLYILTTAFSVVFIESSVSIASPALMLFMSVGLATVFFHLVNLPSIALIYKKAFQDKKNFVCVSLASAAVWLATFYSIKMIDGFSYLFIYFVFAAMIGCVVNIYNEGKHLGLKCVSLVFLTIVLVYFILSERLKTNNNYYLLGVFLALMGGLSGYAFRKFSQLLSRNVNLAASQALAVRSYAILIFSFLLIPQGAFSVMSIKMLPHIVTVTLFSFILPLYYNQRGLLKIGSEKHSIVSAATPLVCCLLSFSINQFWSPTLFFASLLVTGILILAVI